MEARSGFLKLKTAQKKSYDGIQKALTQLLSDIQTALSVLSAAAENPSNEISQRLETNLKEKAAQVTEHLKNYHNHISKYSKVLEKVSLLPTLTVQI
jgi:ElaB/YqjD/DUF883 family membrane-anchored ribosome-binding protein